MIKRFLVHFTTVFAVAVVVCVFVTLLLNLIVYGTDTINWETSFRSAILFAIVFSWIGARRCNESSCRAQRGDH